MELIIYPRLSKKSQYAMTRKKTYWGRDYSYIPQDRLIARLCRELNMNYEQVTNQIQKEREFMLKYGRYY